MRFSHVPPKAPSQRRGAHAEHPADLLPIIACNSQPQNAPALGVEFSRKFFQEQLPIKLLAPIRNSKDLRQLVICANKLDSPSPPRPAVQSAITRNSQQAARIGGVERDIVLIQIP